MLHLIDDRVSVFVCESRENEVTTETNQNQPAIGERLFTDLSCGGFSDSDAGSARVQGDIERTDIPHYYDLDQNSSRE